MEFINKVSLEENNTLAVDFDGVIHSFELGYHDGTIYGTPLPNCFESLQELSKKYKIIIYTAKAKPDRPLVNGKTGTQLVWEWLEKYNLKQFINDVTAEKPRAICYIDDKAIRFETWTQTMNTLNTFLKK